MLVPLMPSVVRSEGSLLAVNLSLKTLNWGEQSSGFHACSICSDGTLDSSAISASASRMERSNKAVIGSSLIRLWWRGIELLAPISKEKNIALLLHRPSTVRENANFGRSDDVTILLFRPKIGRNKHKKIWALKKA